MRTRHAACAGRTFRSNRPTSTILALGATGALFANVPVSSRETSGTHATSDTSGAGISFKASGALRAVVAVFAGSSSIARGTDESSFARGASVALRAHVAVPARVSGHSRRATLAVHAVQARQTPRALHRYIHYKNIFRHNHTLIRYHGAILAVGASLPTHAWNTFRSTGALWTNVALFALGATNARNTGSALIASVALVAIGSTVAINTVAPVVARAAVFAWGSRLPVESWTAVAATIQAVFAVLAGGTSLAWCSSVSFVTDMAFFAGRASVTWGANVALRT